MARGERSWVCSQLGGREHYMVPLGLHRQGALSRLVTDLWVPPHTLLGRVAPRLCDRFHPALDGCVTSFNAAAVVFEAEQAARNGAGWAAMLRRNEWFQSSALQVLQHLTGVDVLVSYSYAARRLFRHAKQCGWATVLIQIDPGPAEERLVAELQAKHPGLERWHPAPPEYWERWHEETTLADRIVVHSEWSRGAMIDAGLPAEKLSVLPLAYEPPAEAGRFRRVYPDRFSIDRPMRVLFLGTVSLRKGLVAILDAARELEGEPVEFVIAGPAPVDDAVRARPGRIRWVGPIPRGRTGTVYQDADVFLFPTLSDGFGLTQLEAQAWQLPIVATSKCGRVVEPGVNGVQLSASSGDEVAAVLRAMLADPAMLVRMSRHATVHARHAPEHFAAALIGSVA